LHVAGDDLPSKEAPAEVIDILETRIGSPERGRLRYLSIERQA
jgi:hypothetical protein